MFQRHQSGLKLGSRSPGLKLGIVGLKSSTDGGTQLRIDGITPGLFV